MWIQDGKPESFPPRFRCRGSQSSNRRSCFLISETTEMAQTQSWATTLPYPGWRPKNEDSLTWICKWWISIPKHPKVKAWSAFRRTPTILSPWIAVGTESCCVKLGVHERSVTKVIQYQGPSLWEMCRAWHLLKFVKKTENSSTLNLPQKKFQPTGLSLARFFWSKST